MDFVHLNPLRIELVKLEYVAIEGALTGQILKPLVKIFLQVAVGHYLVDQRPIVLPEFLLLRIAVDQWFPKQNHLELRDILSSDIDVKRQFKNRKRIPFAFLLFQAGGVVLAKMEVLSLEEFLPVKKTMVVLAGADKHALGSLEFGFRADLVDGSQHCWHQFKLAQLQVAGVLSVDSLGVCPVDV